MADVVERAVALLRRVHEPCAPGLTYPEISAVEERFGFEFSDEHRELLHRVLPLGDRWVDWRSDEPADVRHRLAWPVEGVLFDVRVNAFWPRSWGPRPAGDDEAVAVAAAHLEKVPQLVPVYSHRYLPAAPVGRPAPVFSVHQTDVIYYGIDLADYVAREFGSARASSGSPAVRVPFWSDLVELDDANDL